MKAHAVSNFFTPKNQNSAKNVSFGMSGEQAVQILERVADHAKTSGLSTEHIIGSEDKYVPGVRKLTEEWAHHTHWENGQDRLRCSEIREMTQAGAWEAAQYYLQQQAFALQLFGNKFGTRGRLVDIIHSRIGDYK